MNDQYRGAALSTLTEIGALPQRFLLRLVVGRMFHRYFTVIPARTDELRAIAYAIRYDVYCRELKWEDGGRFDGELETDEFDADSDHVLLRHHNSDSYAGCVRLVRASPLAPDRPLPFEQTCAGTLYPEARQLLNSERGVIGEISRLAVTAGFRRRAGEVAPMGVAEREPAKQSGDRRTLLPNVALALYLAAACAGLEANLRGVFALMEPRLCERLRRHGIVFQQMGEPISHRGMRAPFYIDRPGLFRGLQPKLRALLDIIREDLRRAPPVDTVK